MPGKRITDHQVAQYNKHRCAQSQVAAAAKAGISERSARRIEIGNGLPSQRAERQWRTRADAFEAVWEKEIVPLLEISPHLNGVSILEELQRRYPGEFGARMLRTLQRRMRHWRAVHGGERELYFAQEHPPGRQGISDFTVADDLRVTIGGQAFAHRLYQFALAHSGWRYSMVVDGGESFQAVSTGLQGALWRLGGVPEEHRTDSLSAAFKNLSEYEQNDLTQRYAALCTHYGMRASRCNPGESHENGSIESRNGSLKTALRQALLLRGSVEFSDRATYEAFVDSIVQRMNARIQQRLEVERGTLRPLPTRRTAEYEELSARVSKYGILSIKGAQYSAPSRLIGHRLLVRRYADRIEGWLSGQCVLQAPRASFRNGHKHPRSIDYRHLIEGLKRKPNAFARWVLRDEAFPRAIYRRTWEKLQAAFPERQACKTIVGLLDLAAQGHEASLAAELEKLDAQNQLPDLQTIQAWLTPRTAALPAVSITLPTLSSYDELLEVAQ